MDDAVGNGSRCVLPVLDKGAILRDHSCGSTSRQGTNMHAMGTNRKNLLVTICLLLLMGQALYGLRHAGREPLPSVRAQSFPTRTNTPCPPFAFGPTGTPELAFLPIIRRQEPTATPTETAVPPTATATATSAPCLQSQN